MIPSEPTHPKSPGKERDAIEEDIWEQTQRFIDSIRDEIKSDDPDQVSIGFWLFKIERKVHMLKEHLQGK